MKSPYLEPLPPEIWVKPVFDRLVYTDKATKDRLWQQLEDEGILQMEESKIRDRLQEVISQFSSIEGPSAAEVSYQFLIGKYKINTDPHNTFLTVFSSLCRPFNEGSLALGTMAMRMFWIQAQAAEAAAKARTRAA